MNNNNENENKPEQPKSRLFDKISQVFREAFRVDEHPRQAYPDTVEECLDDSIVYRKGTEEALNDFRKMQPWRGTLEEKQVKFRMLNTELAKIYEIPEPKLVFVEKFPGIACCIPRSKPSVIIMQNGKDSDYSVVAYLHEFGHSLGKGEKGACVWSLNLFKRVFPKAFAKLDQKGHMLYKRKRGKVQTTEVGE